MEKSLETAPFKKDFTSYMAITLFLTVLVGELLLIVWLPLQLRRDTFWEQEIALQEMIHTLDNFRGELRHSRDLGRLPEGQIAMLRSGVDVIAQYVRQYDKYLSSYQIDQIHATLLECRGYFLQLAAGKSYGEEMGIDAREQLKRIFADPFQSPGK